MSIARVEVVDDDDFFTYKTTGGPLERRRRPPRRIVHLVPKCACDRLPDHELRTTETVFLGQEMPWDRVGGMSNWFKLGCPDPRR